MALSLGNTDVVLIATTTNAALATNAGDQLMMLRASVSNTSTPSVTVTVWRVPPGGTTANGEIILEDYAVAANSSQRLPLAGTTLTNGQQLFASATTANIANLNLSYCLL